MLHTWFKPWHSRVAPPTPIMPSLRTNAIGEPGLIELHQVIKQYQTDAGIFTALKGIDLTINSGEFVAIIGKSGSGKSTLLNMLTGIDRPTSGQVTIAGTALAQLNEAALARWRGRTLGVIFQFFQLLPTLTLLENVMLPMDFCNFDTAHNRQDRAMMLLEEVGMAEQAQKMPSAVSGGQQQRVAIARALANDPEIIVADEPTGSLDSKTADVIFQLFARLVKQGKTLILVTHDNELAQRTDRTVVIADGALVADQTLAEDRLAEDTLAKDTLAAEQCNSSYPKPSQTIVDAEHSYV